jgi:hypothetical protein
MTMNKKFTHRLRTVIGLTDEAEYFVIKMGDHPLALPPKRRDWHLTALQSVAILLLAMGALTTLVIWLIVSHSRPW